MLDLCRHGSWNVKFWCFGLTFPSIKKHKSNFLLGSSARFLFPWTNKWRWRTNFLPTKRHIFFPLFPATWRWARKKSTGRVDGFNVKALWLVDIMSPRSHAVTGMNEVSHPWKPVTKSRWKPSKALLPFWMAGDYATPENFRKFVSMSLNSSRNIICLLKEESGLILSAQAKCFESDPNILLKVVGFFTDPRSSPTGFPFKATRFTDSLSEENLYLQRQRICDLGYLRHTYQKEDGSLGQRCPAEPIADYIKKVEQKKKLKDANAFAMLYSRISAWPKSSPLEKRTSLLTAGDDFESHSTSFKNGQQQFSSKDVVKYLFAKWLAKNMSIKQASSLRSWQSKRISPQSCPW